jgi:hypothetical protein
MTLKTKKTKKRLKPFSAMRKAGSFFCDPRTKVLYFVPMEGGAAQRCDRPEFTETVCRVLDRSPSSPRFKQIHDSIIHTGKKKAQGAEAEYVTAYRERDGSHCFYVHLGRGAVVRSRDGGDFEQVRNGMDGILFEDESKFEPLNTETVLNGSRRHGGEFSTLKRVLLDRLPPPGGLLTREEQQGLVLATVLGIFVRPLAGGRPITLALGPAGSGKSVTQRLVAKIFYGPGGDTVGGTSSDRVMKDIAASAAHSPLVVRDDINALPPGAIDTLCRIATGGEFEVAAFYETLAVARHTSRGLICVSAFMPSWLNRADLLTRFLMLVFALGSPSTLTEKNRIRDVLQAREAIWAELLAAMRMWSQPLPEHQAIGRFDDWERALFPVMARAGYGSVFASAMRKIPRETLRVAANADPLQHQLLLLAQRPDVNGQWLTAAQLVERLNATMGATDTLDTNRGLARDPLRLAQFLSKVHNEGSAVINVEKRGGRDNTQRWCLTPKLLPDEVGGGAGGVGGVSDPSSSLSKEKEKGAEGATPPSPLTPPEPACQDNGTQAPPRDTIH